jgi:ABC-type dipeptide/oligopeptide/nickel transport system permease subunit
MDGPYPDRGRSPTALAIRRLLRSRTAVAGLVLTAILVFVGLFSPWLTVHDYRAISFDSIHKPPGTPGHLLGTDELGRDVMARLMQGASLSLRIGVGATVLALAFGTAVGLVSGYFGGWLDSLLQRIVDTFLAFPTLLLAIGITAVFEYPSETILFVVLGIVSWPPVARVVRGQVLSLRENDFVLSARSLGARDGRILFLHLLPNCIGPIVVLGTLEVASNILAEAGMSFLGIGVQPPEPSWGRMLLDAQKYHEVSPWLGVYPGAAIVLTVLGLNFFGDGLRDAFDPRMKV